MTIQVVYHILFKNINDLHNVANALLEFESITGKDMEKIIKGEKIVKLDDNKDDKPKSRRSSKNKIQENNS